MKTGGFNKKSLTLMILIALCLWCSRFETCQAREGKYWTQSEAGPATSALVKKENGYGGNHGRRLSKFMGDMWNGEAQATQQYGKPSSFNVLDYGAKGDGHTDDTNAWTDAGKVARSKILVPAGSVFFVGPVSFLGSGCGANIELQLDGTILAPVSSKIWGSGLLQWIEFKELNGFTIQGKGTIDGRGSVWWNDLPSYGSEWESEVGNQLDGKMPSTKPTALRFYGSTGVTVTGITIQNSPQTHLKFDSCTGVQVSDFTTSSPGNSPNTDGIHLQNSQNVLIYSSDLACGDDCISIQTGCSNVFIHNVNCGPGHGISIGGLGKDNTKACVSNVTVRDVSMHNTLTGVRIKTWQGGSGSVQGITFSNVQVSGVGTPIMIDQFYCDGSICKNDSSAVALTGINYLGIKGTYTEKPIHFACSDSMPCVGVSLSTIELTASEEDSPPLCWNAYGTVKTTTLPPVDCLRTGKSRYPTEC
uniref:Putative style polygalacturonase n=1 Tax=Turnera subulata TaxID=218843 RepID=Q27IM4_9ROSI|nr:putative style polygalacturonase [Turnera subulata]